MGLAAQIRKGLKFFLMSLGVSSPEKKPRPASKPASTTDPGASK